MSDDHDNLQAGPDLIDPVDCPRCGHKTADPKTGDCPYCRMEARWERGDSR